MASDRRPVVAPRRDPGMDDIARGGKHTRRSPARRDVRLFDHAGSLTQARTYTRIQHYAEHPECRERDQRQVDDGSDADPDAIIILQSASVRDLTMAKANLSGPTHVNVARIGHVTWEDDADGA